MVNIWDKVVPLSETIISKFSKYEQVEIKSDYHIDVKNFSWKNYLWTSDKFRRAHIEIVDAREEKKIWVMHMCVFPNYDDPSPIFGFDIVCGKNKITGAFHDFSPVGQSDMFMWYVNNMKNYEWENIRQLPEWALQIFSKQMLAVSNINTEKELDQLCHVAIDNLDFYLYNVGSSKDNNTYVSRHNHYCKFQKQNPHTPAMMKTLGVDENIFRTFMDEILFPEENE